MNDNHSNENASTDTLEETKQCSQEDNGAEETEYYVENPQRVTKDFAKVWERKNAMHYTGSVSRESQHAKFIVMNDSTIPCNADYCDPSGKYHIIKLTVVRPHSAGFTTAPYSNNNKKPEGPLKPLSELIIEDGSNGNDKKFKMKMWSFEKSKQMGCRGQRNDDNFVVVETGDVLVYLVSPDSFMKNTMASHSSTQDRGDTKLIENFPSYINEIPPFSLLEAVISTKNSDSAKDGSFVRISRIAVSGLSLYSYVPTMTHFESSLEDAKRRADMKAAECTMMSKDMDTEHVSFWVSAENGSFMNAAYDPTLIAKKKAGKDAGVADKSVYRSDPLLSLSNWSSGLYADKPVDIFQTTLLKYTNAVPADKNGVLMIGENVENDLTWANTLITVAASMGALDLFVSCNKYWSVRGITSNMRAVPVINTAKLMQSVKLEADTVASEQPFCKSGVALGGVRYYTFNTGCFYVDESGDRLPILITIFDELCKSTMENGECNAPLKDLAICRMGVAGEGYKFQIILQDGDLEKPILTAKLLASQTGRNNGFPIKRARFGLVE